MEGSREDLQLPGEWQTSSPVRHRQPLLFEVDVVVPPVVHAEPSYACNSLVKPVPSRTRIHLVNVAQGGSLDQGQSLSQHNALDE